MKSGIQNESPLKFLLAIVGLTAFAMVMTTGIAYLVTSPPREFMFWIVVGFLCTIEFMLGILYVNTFARDRCEYRPSGAILSITYGIVGAFAITGLISISIYALVRDEQGSKDGIFSGILMALIVSWFIIAFFLYAYDLHSQSFDRPAQKKRAEHQSHSRNLRHILQSLRNIRTDSDLQRKGLEISIKKMEMIDAALAHSHGGGVRSWESRRQRPVTPENDNVIQNGIDLLFSILPKLSKSNPEDRDAAFEELEQCIAQISMAVDAHGLQ